jgi:hypothetical protein
MATSTTASSTNTARRAGEGNDQLEPHTYADGPNYGVEADARAGSSDSYSLGASDPAPRGHDPAPQGKDGLSEALKAERRRSSFALQIVDCHRRYSHQGNRGGDG